MPENPDPDAPVFLGGSSRPYQRFSQLCNLARLRPRIDVETGEEKSWLLKDLRKTCATYYDEHVPESSIEILGHSVGGVTYRHYAHRAPLAFRAITTLPQPSAFAAMVNGFDVQCPCCRREFEDAASVGRFKTKSLDDSISVLRSNRDSEPVSFRVFQARVPLANGLNFGTLL